MANEIGFRTFGDDLNYRPDQEERLTEYVTRRFNGASPDPGGSELPVFIVGMIRSGTTLLDAKLCRHPQIASAGELKFWDQEATRIYETSLDSATVRDTERRFLNILRRVDRRAFCVVDKMPLNYRHLGLIQSILPNARFIHLRRDARDTCLSIWTTEFGRGVPRFGYRKDNILHAYRQYLRLMEHWRRTMPPDRFIEADYEALVQDEPHVLEMLFEFLGVSSEFEPLLGPGEVTTPSRWQVRQPVYRSSVGRWKRYEPWISFANIAD